jgi:hypothetical protein
MNAEKKQLRQADYLEHMLDAIRLARSYVDGLSREDFLADKKTQQAVVLNIVVIGDPLAVLPPKRDARERPPGRVEACVQFIAGSQTAYKSFGARPVCFAILASMRGPISSAS